MNRTKMLLALLLVAGTAHANDAATDKVLECMRGNIPKIMRIQEFELNAVDPAGGSRVLRGRLFAVRQDDLMRAMVKIKAPADLNNAAYLVREGKERDDMFIFLPALNRVRRIMGGSADSPLFGTDLSYSDIKQVQNAFSGGPVKLEKADVLEGRPVHVLAMTPSAAAQSNYTLIRGWVDQKTCVALKVEFYEGTAVRKRLSSSAKSLKQAGSNWYTSEALMEDLRTKSHTTLKITGLTNVDKLSERYFNATSFYTAE
jgi:hypothetical protein